MAQEKSGPKYQGKMYLLYKLKFWARREMVFYSKNITKSHAIFLLGKVCQGPKNIQELSQIFRSIKMRVALEHKFLKRVSGRKMNIFLYEKYSFDYFGDLSER